MDEHLISKLRQRLTEPLPGSEAHLKMKPILPNGTRFLNTNPATAKRSAVLILLYQEGDEWYFPLIQRPMYDGIHSGQMALPGGRMEPEDTNLTETALRENFEEIGVDPRSVTVIGNLSEFFVAVSNNLVLPVVGFCESRPSYVPDPREVDHVIDAPLGQLMNKNLLKEKDIIAASGYKLRSPYFEIENKTVWGATAMMLSEFVEIIKEMYDVENHK